MAGFCVGRVGSLRVADLTVCGGGRAAKLACAQAARLPLRTQQDGALDNERELATGSEDPMTDALARLEAAGVSVWLDDLSRERLTSGSLAALARDNHVSGVTTNPTIFARSIADSDAYTGQIRD